MRNRALWLLCAAVLATSAIAGIRVGSPHVGRGGIGGGIGGVSPGLADEDAALFVVAPEDDEVAKGGAHTRTSTATYTDASGVIQTAGSGSLRDNHHISSVRTTLLESSRTNLLLRSEEFDNAAWTLGASASVLANQSSAPSSTTTADQITFSADAASADIYQTATTTIGTAYTASVWIKAATATSVFFGFSDNLSVTIAGGFVPINTGWQRLTISGTATTASSRLRLRCGTGQQSLPIMVWGAQLEAGASASSYIPTTAATVTRAADSLAYTLGSYPNWTRWEWFYNSAGVLTETVTTGTGSYSFTPTVDRAYRKIVIAKETRDVAYFAGYK